MMRFVIVDDDKAAANALAKKLAAYDETELCGIALNGLDGLRMINETRPDVLFLDIELPDISGIEFLEHVNCLPQYKCRTVMYTAHDRFMLSAFRNKAFDYLIEAYRRHRAAQHRATRLHRDGWCAQLRL